MSSIVTYHNILYTHSSLYCFLETVTLTLDDIELGLSYIVTYITTSQDILMNHSHTELCLSLSLLGECDLDLLDDLELGRSSTGVLAGDLYLSFDLEAADDLELGRSSIGVRAGDCLFSLSREADLDLDILDPGRGSSLTDLEEILDDLDPDLGISLRHSSSSLPSTESWRGLGNDRFRPGQHLGMKRVQVYIATHTQLEAIFTHTADQFSPNLSIFVSSGLKGKTERI